MKSERLKALGTIAARHALKQLGSASTVEALENAALAQLAKGDLSASELRIALATAVRDIHQFKRST